MASSGVEVHTTSTDVIIKAKKNVKHPYIFWPNQRMEMTVVVNVGEDAAVGDINGTVDIINNTTRVKLTATKNGSLTTPVERGLDITFHVQVDKDEQIGSSIEESGKHDEKSCFVHPGPCMLAGTLFEAGNQ